MIYKNNKEEAFAERMYLDRCLVLEEDVSEDVAADSVSDKMFVVINHESFEEEKATIEMKIYT